jgi:CBS-domain-containing membrane protein
LQASDAHDTRSVADLMLTSPKTLAGDAAVQLIRPDEPAAVAFSRSSESPLRRLVVVDDRHALLGLVCLHREGTGFCGASQPTAVSTI